MEQKEMDILKEVKPSVRPIVTQEMKIEAAKHISKWFDDEFKDDEAIGQIAEAYSPLREDGYAIAKWLDDTYYWQIDSSMVESFDGMSWYVSNIHKEAIRKWVVDYHIFPNFEIGTPVEFNKGFRKSSGVIAAISIVDAQYKIKEEGCTREGRFVLVNYEDAERVVKPALHS